MLFLFVPVMFWSAISPPGCWFEDGRKTCVVAVSVEQKVLVA